MNLGKRQSAHGAWRATLWASALALAVGLYFQGAPWSLDPSAKSSDGAEIAREAKADVVLVIDYASIRTSPDSFEKKDWSAAWVNVLEQEVGPVTIATPQSLSEQVVQRARVVILTASAAHGVGDGLMGQLERHVRKGGTLVLERPKGALRVAFSADGRAGERRARAITHARDLTAPFDKELMAAPLSTEYVGSTASREGATTWMSMDGAPVIYAIPRGQGAVITIEFDLGEQLVATQQGRPKEGWTLGVGEGPERVEALISDERLVGAMVPYADMLERFIVHGVIAHYAPLPALWYYPGGADGVVVGVHEDDQLGDGAGWMLDHERTQRSVSTLLVTHDSGLTAAGAATIHRKGGDIGLLWRLPGTPEERDERLGAAGFTPLARPLWLGRQLDVLKKTLPVNYVRTARIMDGWWTREWDGAFRRLSQVGVRIDTTYQSRRTSGYAFGTGLPFLALSSEGIPLGVREMPIVVGQNVVEGPELEALLKSSSGGHHMAIPYASSPAAFADYPDMQSFGRWLDTFESIASSNHRLTSAARLDSYLRSRRASALESRLVDASDDQRPGVRLLRVTVEAKARGMWLHVPERVGGATFSTAKQAANRVGGELVSGELETRPGAVIGIPRRFVPLERGFNTVDITYTPN